MWVLIHVDSQLGIDSRSIQRKILSLFNDQGIALNLKLKQVVFILGIVEMEASDCHFAIRLSFDLWQALRDVIPTDVVSH